MRKLLTVIFGLVFLALVGSSSIYFFAPHILVEAGIEQERKQSGLSRHTVEVDGHQMPYLRGGPSDGPVIMMVHGYAANKDNWVRFAKHFVDRYQVIIPDLPGFGEASRIDSANYNIPIQTQRLFEFAKALQLPRFHVVGNSMGGWLAASMAMTDSEALLSIGLFAAAGVHEPKPSPMAEALAQGKNILLMEQPEDFDRVIKLMFNHPPAMPQIAKDYVFELAQKEKPFNEKVAADLLAERIWLEGKLDNVSLPSLILWGDSDRVIDPSAAKVYQQQLPHASVVIMEDTGHLPQLERPKKTAKHYQRFLQQVSGK
ncbi:MAG: alpha/beta hydrolase [Cellvibrionaceae bacterium]|nr:alpha/beta hydrolase [Cellvibrionaceae bacterium]MCV6626408.1 alpha/beta hydrolase [Cellvibrionaceae bacterium]